MSKRLAVPAAIVALVKLALPNAEVVGIVGDAAVPDRIAPGGRVTVRFGDPGDPEIDLSPLTYHYSHAIPLEVEAYAAAGDTAPQVVDAMLAAIAAAVEADRTLGGLVDWLDGFAPASDDLYAEGAAVAHGADAQLTADYSTTHPL